MRLIDADKLTEKIRRLPNAGIRWFVSAEAVFDEILNAPTESAERTGEWIDLGKDKCIRWKCSECGRKDTHIYDFCPDCGARMVGKDGGIMTEKEAIEILEDLRDAIVINAFGFSKDVQEINEALTLAIKKLSN